MRNMKKPRKRERRQKGKQRRQLRKRKRRKKLRQKQQKKLRKRKKRKNLSFKKQKKLRNLPLESKLQKKPKKLKRKRKLKMMKEFQLMIQLPKLVLKRVKCSHLTKHKRKLRNLLQCFELLISIKKSTNLKLMKMKSKRFMVKQLAIHKSGWMLRICNFSTLFTLMKCPKSEICSKFNFILFK